MKVLITALCILCTKANSQEQIPFFVSFSTGYTFSGIHYSLTEQMGKQHFRRDPRKYWTLIFNPQEMPYHRAYFNGRLIAGRRLNAFKTVYAIVGIIDRSRIYGLLKTSDPFYPISRPGYALYPQAVVTYTLAQLAAGVQFTMRSRTRLSIAPSGYLLHYRLPDNSAHRALKPGLSGYLKMPLGPAVRPVGLEVIIELNAAPAVEMNDGQTDRFDFKPGKASLLAASIGLAITFRKQEK